MVSQEDSSGLDNQPLPTSTYGSDTGGLDRGDWPNDGSLVGGRFDLMQLVLLGMCFALYLGELLAR